MKQIFPVFHATVPCLRLAELLFETTPDASQTQPGWVRTFRKRVASLSRCSRFPAKKICMKSLLLRSVECPHFDILEADLDERLEYGFRFVQSIDHHAASAEPT